MYVKCDNCHREGDLSMPESFRLALLSCCCCGEPLKTISVEDWSGWIEARVQAKAEQQRVGRIGNRQQSIMQSDREIDRNGLAAELAAAVLIAPNNLAQWMKATESGGNNRGRDLPPDMT